MTDREFQEFVVSRLALLTEGQEKHQPDCPHNLHII